MVLYRPICMDALLFCSIFDTLQTCTGLDVWRQKDESGLYDCRVLRKRTNDIKWMIEQGDIFNLMFRIRGGLARDMYGMQHEGLFSRAAAGTKTLVEDYHATVAGALDYICDSTSDQVISNACFSVVYQFTMIVIIIFASTIRYPLMLNWPSSMRHDIPTADLLSYFLEVQLLDSIMLGLF